MYLAHFSAPNLKNERTETEKILTFFRKNPFLYFEMNDDDA